MSDDFVHTTRYGGATGTKQPQSERQTDIQVAKLSSTLPPSLPRVFACFEGARWIRKIVPDTSDISMGVIETPHGLRHSTSLSGIPKYTSCCRGLSPIFVCMTPLARK